MLERLVKDLRFAGRLLRKTPGLTAVAVLTLALCLGANIAIFAVISSVLLKPLPYLDSDHLMILTETGFGIPEPSELSYLNYKDWRDRSHSFSAMAVFRDPQFLNLTTPDGPKVITSRMVSASFFATLGIGPMLGRDFRPEDDQLGATPTIILSYGAWQRYFGGGYSIVGKSLSISGTNYTVIGVASSQFTFYSNPDIYVPIELARLSLTSAREYRPGLNALGRLKPEVTQTQAQADLSEIASRLGSLYPQANSGRGASVRPIFKDVVGDIGSTLYLLWGAVGFLLLIGCVNIANLLLGRGSARQKEIAVRIALGAGRWRVARQLLTEGVLLSLTGGMVGAVLAATGTRTLVAFVPRSLPRVESVGVDWRVFAFAFLLSTLTGLIFGLAPAIQGVRVDVNSRLQEGGFNSTRRLRVTQNVLGVMEVAFGLVLLASAGLVLRSTANLIGVDPGFDPRDVLVFKILTSPREFASGQAVLDFYRELEQRLRAIPSVEAASMAMGDLPMQGGPHFPLYVAERGKPASVATMSQGLGYINDPDYLRVMHIGLLRGRYFDSHDVFTSPPVIVVDETLVRTVFAGDDPLGKHLVLGLPGFDQPREIIGIVNHVKHWGLDTDEHAQVQNEFYLPAGQFPPAIYAGAPQGLMMVMRSGLPPTALIPQVQNAVSQFHHNLPVYRAQTMSDIVLASIAARRFATLLLALFAAVAFILCAIGIYGVMAYSVAERKYEFGVRSALGAQTRDIARMVVNQGAKIGTAGILIGLVASLALTRFIGSLLYGVRAFDPSVFATVAAMLLAIALAGSYIPVRPSLLADPISALRGTPVETPSYTDHRAHRTPKRFALAPSSETGAVIETYELTKIYRSFRRKPLAALGGVSLSVGRGTIFGLIGQNGAGKTTLLKILMGLSSPTSGYALLLGRSPGEPLTRRLVGYLPEQMHLPDFFQATDFLQYMGRLGKVDSATLKRRIPDVLEKVGLSGVRKPLKAFSKGMQQRLGLAQALLNDPDLLFLDEPTDGLDPLGRRDVRNLLVSLRAAGKTILLNSHLLSEVESVCDQIVILNKGKIARRATPNDFTRGTGTYRVRLTVVDDVVRAAVAESMCLGEWQGTTFQCRPRDIPQLNLLIDRLRSARAEIESVEAVKFSLEQFFVNVVTEES